MKLHIMSDVHLGVSPLPPAELAGDALLMAGDIGDDARHQAFKFARNYWQAYLPIIYIPGNHEFYGKNIAAELLNLDRVARREGVTLLYNKVLILGNVRFVGATLWTDFRLYSDDPSEAMYYAAREFPDYLNIFYKGRTLKPEHTARFHARTLRFLERVFATPFAGKTVVITHHAPSIKSIHPRFKTDPLNACYASNLDEHLLRWQPDLWVHGHTHDEFDYFVGKTRVICHPRGYAVPPRQAQHNLSGQDERKTFDAHFVIDL